MSRLVNEELSKTLLECFIINILRKELIWSNCKESKINTKYINFDKLNFIWILLKYRSFLTL